MNYIELLNNYWSLREQGILDRNAGDLYLYLIHKSNSLGWKNPFNQSNALICGFLSVNEKTLIANRNKIKQEGLIDFVSGKKGSNSEYTLLPVFTVRKGGQNYREYNSLSVSEYDNLKGSEYNSLGGQKSADNTKHILNQTKQDDDGGSAIAIELERMKKKVAAQEKIIQGLGKNKKSDLPPPGSAPSPSVSGLFKTLEELQVECRDDKHFSEPIRMKNGLSAEQLSEWLSAFNRELLFNGISKKLPRDYRSHFARWLKYQDLRSDPADYSPVKEQKNETGSTGATKGTSAERATAGRNKYAQRVRQQFPGVEQ